MQRPAAAILQCTLVAVLIAPIPVPAQDDRTVAISGYSHDPCEVTDEAGYRQLVYPQFAQQGGETRVSLSQDGYWNCNTKLDAGIRACRDATRAPRPVWGISPDALDGCDAIFESMAGECVAHYERQRHKCSVDGSGYADGDSAESDYAAALNNALEGNDYRAALDEADRKAAQRLRMQEEERKRQGDQDRTVSETADSGTPDNQDACLRIVEAWSGELQAVDDTDACNMANSIVRIASRVLDNLAANSCPAEYQENLKEQIDYWQSLSGSLCF